jgi:hypothetical protein
MFVWMYTNGLHYRKRGFKETKVKTLKSFIKMIEAPFKIVS